MNKTSETSELFFVDGIENLSYTAGAFRFDLASIKPWSQKDQAKSQKPSTPQIESQTQAHVVMTPQGFIQTLRAMENFLKLVEEKGVIRLNEPASDTHIRAENEKSGEDQVKH